MLKAIIFDVDGTIIDTEQAILNALKDTLENEGYSYTLGDLRFVFGIPGKDALEQLEIENKERVHMAWAEKESILIEETQPFAGIEEIIQELGSRPIQLGIVTSKNRKEFQNFAKRKISVFFETAVVVEDTSNHKPHPEPLELCLKRLGVEPDEAIYIGDSIYDNQCASQAGVKFGLALWGSKTTEGYNADYIFEEPMDILRLLNK